MANCSDQKNPLHNTGTSQLQRLLPGLNRTAFAVPDEKDFADWIVFANDYATFINYYNGKNIVDGNWQPFFSNDISARLGTIALQNIDRYQLEIKERFDFIRDDDNKTSLTQMKRKLNELFSSIFTLSKGLDNAALNLPDETTLQQTVFNLIKTKLSPALGSLIAYYKAAESHGYIDRTDLTASWIILNQPLTDAQQIMNTNGLSNSWFDTVLYLDWETYKNSIAADESIFNNPLTAFTDDFLSLEHAANHNLFTGIFDTYLSGYTKTIQEAETELLKTLETYDAHTPHYALFLSFLMLFRFTQTHINTLTQRHLDFYYKEVLRLQPRPAEANKAHVIGELAKNVSSYLLDAGTLLKAGKDSLNKEVNYTLDNDTVFNKAKIAQLKSFYLAEEADTIYEPGSDTIFKQKNNGRAFAAPVANSDDGIGTALTSANKEWQPFVHKTYNEAQLESIAMPKAELGFALASHYLFLAEGERTITLKFNTGTDNSKLTGKAIQCYITTEKGWLEIGADPSTEISPIKTGILSKGSVACAQFEIQLHGDAPSTSNYNVDLHGGTFGVELPIVKVMLAQNDLNSYQYNELKEIKILQTEISVEAGETTGFSQTGIKQLTVSNDFGPVDVSKPFMPFGSLPAKGSSFLIGSKEIFSKKNASIKCNLQWAGLPTDPTKIAYDPANVIADNYPYTTMTYLATGIWNNLNTNLNIFSGINENVSFPPSSIQIPESATVGYPEPYDNYGINDRSGFIKISLNGNFGYKTYTDALSTYLVELATETDPPTYSTKPFEPYTPLIKSLSLSYKAYKIENLSAADEQSFDKREISFFHIYPFGEAEQHKFISPSTDVYLLPQFKHVIEGSTIHHTGELFIGIENLNPNEAVNILFQVMEGTTNPTLDKPADHLHWSFLSNNNWTDFDASAISDNTLQLVQSGIISFGIPAEATTDNTMLPAGYIWIKAAVKEAAEAVCKLITLNAQASIATFTNNGNAADFLDKALPAGTISKLKIPDASVKTISQPYPSFGGRSKENEDHFYVRVSERLRHKARAITVWDYEHLVLEEFPEIYKVKCLNHTRIENGIYHEVKPGYVSIITIPSQENRNDADPLKPFTQQSTLTKIEDYLRMRTSCFVQVKASQPQFEEVRLEFSLKLYVQYQDFTFYAEKLKQEITQYLSPWAYGNDSTLDFGGKVYKSVLINFIEERYYVDFITDIFMYVTVDKEVNESGDQDEIIASTARSILVSAPASKHMIHELEESTSSTEEVCMDKNKIKENK